MNTIRFIPCLLLAMLTITAVGTGQNRDFQAQRLVIDDSAADGLFNTMTVQTPNPLLQNVILTFPDPGSTGAQILLAPPGSDGAWLLNGNAGTTAGTNFIGTTDNVALHVRTNNTDRMVFNTNGSIQRDAGGNLRGANAIDLQAIRFAATQVASGLQSVVGGGFANTASGGQSTVGGGFNNNAAGLQSTVGGGINNTASESFSTVAGGTNNTASGGESTVGGGFDNTAGGAAAVIGGGSGNTASGIYATLGGGFNNTASGLQSTVGGGFRNTASGDQATTAGGSSTTASGLQSVVGGGGFNTASGVSATVGGGSRNMVAGDNSAIPGGRGLTLDTAADGSFGFLGDNAGGSKNMTISTPNVAVFGNTDLWLANNDSAASQLRFYEAYNTNGAFPNGTNYTSFEAGAQASDINYILPVSTAATTTVEEGILQLDTATGQLSWLDPATVATTFAWSLTGNAGTTAGTNFIGTTDNVALHVRTNNVDRLIFNLNGSIQRDSGGDIRGPRAIELQTNRSAATQVASGFGATISGGANNTASSQYSSVGGGITNSTTNDYATVGGGIENVASGQYATVAGGRENGATSSGSAVGGGFGNVGSGPQSVVSGGSSNIASGVVAVVGGGISNRSSYFYSTVSGGIQNRSTGRASMVAGGANNNANGDYSTVAGGRGLTIDGDGSFGFLTNTGLDSMIVSESNVAVFGNTDMWLANNDSAASQLRFYEAYDTAGAFPNGTNYTSFEAGPQASDINYILPLSTTSTATLEEGLLQLDTATGQLSWLDPATVATTFAWSLTGNAGTTAGTNFIGTTDSVALHMRTNNVDRMIFNTNGSIQRDTGGDVRGANAIDMQVDRFAATQVASGLHSVISGGERNTASGMLSTVGGGLNNTASGDSATVGGGADNSASGGRSTVAGGQGNTASEIYATVAGGTRNSAGGGGASVGGGQLNLATATLATVAGGNSNQAQAGGSSIGGGQRNTASGTFSTIGGGEENTVSGLYSIVAGGYLNTVSGGLSAIPGGRGLTIDATRSFGFLGGNGGANDMTISTSDVAVFGNTDLWLANNNNGASQLRFYEAYNTSGAFPNTANYSSFEAGAQTGNINYILPTTLPTAGQILQASAVAGTTVTLTWAADATVTARDGDDTPTSIAVTESREERIEILLRRLESLKMRHRLEIEALEAEVRSLTDEGSMPEARIESGSSQKLNVAE